VLIKCLGYGGAEQLLVHMMRHRDRERFEYEVAYVLESENALVPEIEAAGVPVHALGARSNRDLGWTFRLRGLLLRGNYDIVHFHLPYAAVFGRMVAITLPRRRRPALVSTEHTLWNRLAVLWRALNRATIGLDDRVLIVSEAARRTLPPSLQQRVRVVVHGIEPDPVRAAMQEREALRRDVRAEFGLREGEVLALTVANLRPEKGHDVLLRAARLTADRSLPIRFVAAGQGPMRDELEAQHRQLGLGDRFVFAGERSDVLRLLAGADLFVLPSRQEGLPVVIMEATTAGVPLVVTAVGELPLLFSDGVDALVVPPDRADALADAVAAVAGDADLRKRLAYGSLARGELFDVTRCVREIEDVYDEVRPPRPAKKGA
jgi:glycosyltransferase involved in cell wall biosynthesis